VKRMMKMMIALRVTAGGVEVPLVPWEDATERAMVVTALRPILSNAGSPSRECCS
jgi:hypothetical protein